MITATINLLEEGDIILWSPDEMEYIVIDKGTDFLVVGLSTGKRVGAMYEKDKLNKLLNNETIQFVGRIDL